MAALDLRPLSLGELLDRTFFLYRRHFYLFTGIAAIPYSLFLIVNLTSTLLGGSHLARGGPVSAVGTGAVVGGAIAAFALFFAGFVAFLFSTGASVFAVSEIYMGRSTSIAESLRKVRGHSVTVLGVLFLSGVIMLGGFILLIVPGIYLGCRISVATAAALLENTGASNGIRRSFELTRDFAGRAFMIYLLYFALFWGVISLFQMPFLMLIGVYAKQPQMMTTMMILSQVGSFFGSVLVTPISMIGFALFYYDLRVRKEAFDLQVMMQAIGDDPVTPPVAGGAPSMFGQDAS